MDIPEPSHGKVFQKRFTLRMWWRAYEACSHICYLTGMNMFCCPYSPPTHEQELQPLIARTHCVSSQPWIRPSQFFGHCVCPGSVFSQVSNGAGSENINLLDVPLHQRQRWDRNSCVTSALSYCKKRYGCSVACMWTIMVHKLRMTMTHSNRLDLRWYVAFYSF